MKTLNIKPNYSELARIYNLDRRTIEKYNNGYCRENIKIIRNKLNYTQQEIADMFSYHRVTIANYEDGNYIIPINYLVKLSILSKIPTDYIVGIIRK